MTLCTACHKPVDFPEVKCSSYQVAVVELVPIVPQLIVLGPSTKEYSTRLVK